jgi:hypothetical protein
MNPGYTSGDGKVTASSAILRGLMDEKEEEIGEKETKKTMYTTSRTFLTFGHGKHSWYVITCPHGNTILMATFNSPGRFFAALELKVCLASLVLDYDLRWPDDAPKDDGHGNGYRPDDVWFGGSFLPNMKARVLIRKCA